MPDDNTGMVRNVGGGAGRLRVNVYLSGVGKPAEGAAVRVSDPSSGKILGELTSNAAGRMEAFELETPPLEYSLAADSPRPFNQYNVSVSLPYYKEAAVQNVQVFPSCTSLQNVALTAAENVLIPYPVLWGDYPPKIPESDVKKLPFPDNLAVLPEPVVPEYITVHAGRPDNASAPNYTVGFRDYVKNVASSEIYASWPRETLKANILAIISFTMNRVYTEWYRGKGYDFTITNSTAFDQSFTYGRNIYEEISDVADEVFTTYISKSDISQPLFTQYCDGRKVRRDGWLSQWGSCDLGAQGYSAIQILKNYYGYEIILREAKKVEGVPLSFPGVLSVGSSGDSVRTIQHQLNVIARNYPLIPKLVEDGVYGDRTAEAVKVYQGIFDLPETGRVNFPTWYSISDVYVAVSGLA
jgi:hypothetical protein